MQNVIVNGANGRMGRATVETLSAHPDFELVAQLGGQDDLAQAIKQTQAKIVIDFTKASCAFENTQCIIENDAHPVIGTSGLLPEQITTLQHLAKTKQLGGIIAPNFSIGAILMMKYAQDAAKYLPNVEILEIHHDGKKDSPSGTAMKTADMIAASRTEKPALIAMEENIPGARGANHHEIPIHAVRLPGFVASQEVIFGSHGESLKIRHDSINRECFMPGVVLACEKVLGLSELIYGLEHILTSE